MEKIILVGARNKSFFPFLFHLNLKLVKLFYKKKKVDFTIETAQMLRERQKDEVTLKEICTLFKKKKFQKWPKP